MGVELWRPDPVVCYFAKTTRPEFRLYPLAQEPIGWVSLIFTLADTKILSKL